MSTHGKLVLLVFTASLFATDVTAAKTATQVFREASPSVVLVRASDRNGRVVATGSGVVVIAREQVVTNCHVVKSRENIAVGYRGKYLPATLDVADYQLDLCGLIVPGLSTPPARIAPLRSLLVGARVFAIGAPKGLELSISDGIISSIRQRQGKPVIQTTAPISPGSSGGGLFDDQARLIGITTFYLVDGQNLNFAVPAELVASLGQGSESQVLTFDEHVARSIDQSSKIIGLIGEKKYVEAIQAATELTAQQPTNPLAWLLLGNAFEKQKISARAIDAYKKALEFHAIYSPAWEGLGNVYLSIERIDLARQAFEELLLTDPRSSAAYVGLARIRLHYEDKIGAMTLYEKAIRVSLDRPLPDFDALDHALLAFCGIASFLQLPEKQNDCRTLSQSVNAKAEGIMNTMRKK